MFVYLDETGDTGFKFDKGSSRYFVVTILLTADPLPLNGAIEEFRSMNHFAIDHEFKFYSSPDSVRSLFLRLIPKHECLIRCLVVDKRLITRPQMQKKETFYNHLVKMLLRYDNGRLRDAQIVLDRRDRKKSNQTLAAYLRREVNGSGTAEKKIADIRFHDSRSDNLIQAVDMASGAINAYYSKGRPEFIDIIRPRIDDIWEYES